MPREVRALVLDLGGVVFKQARNVKMMMPFLPEGTIDYWELKEKYLKASSGEISEEEFLKGVVTKEKMLEILDTHELTDGARETMNWARKRGIIVCAITNNLSPWVDYLCERHVLSFDTLVVSDKARSRKPDERIYLEFLRESGLEAKDCLFVDDDEENVLAARKLGFSCVLLRTQGSEGTPGFEPSIGSLRELERIL